MTFVPEKGMVAADRRIHVTKNDIETAKPKDSSHCMIADAIKRQVPEARFVAVDIQTIRFTDSKKGLRYVYLTPRPAQVALVKFDQGIQPTPFNFRLRYGQVTKAGVWGHNQTGSRKKPRNLAKRKSALPPPAPSPAKLVKADKSHATPTIVGGRPPPQVVRGNRREFGVRALTK